MVINCKKLRALNALHQINDPKPRVGCAWAGKILEINTADIENIPDLSAGGEWDHLPWKQVSGPAV